jgi:hypothetical protein
MGFPQKTGKSDFPKANKRSVVGFFHFLQGCEYGNQCIFRAVFRRALLRSDEQYNRVARLLTGCFRLKVLDLLGYRHSFGRVLLTFPSMRIQEREPVFSKELWALRQGIILPVIFSEETKRQGTFVGQEGFQRCLASIPFP